MSTVFLRGVERDALEDYWERERPAEVRVSAHGKWLRLDVLRGAADKLAERLSGQFDTETRSHWERNSAGASAVTVFRRGKQVRRLVCAEYRWVEVEGRACRWEAALGAPPTVDEEGPHQYGLLDAMGMMDRAWGPSFTLEGPAEDHSASWIVAALYGVPIVLVLLLFWWLCTSDSVPG